MNAPSEIHTLLRDAHRRAIEQANCWRGRCVNHFARGELIIGNALQKHISAKQLPMLLSQKIARLAALSASHPKQIAALQHFQLEAGDRNKIVHGEGKVFVNGEGRWMLTLEVLDRSGSSRHQITQDDADERAKRLKSLVDRLSAAFPA